MSLRETALFSTTVFAVVPVLAAYFRHRLGLVSLCTFLVALSFSMLLGILWGLIALGAAPGAEVWALGVLACGVPVLVTGYVFSGVLGRESPRAALRSMGRPLVFLLGVGVTALIFMRDPLLLAGYHWRGGNGLLVLGPLGKMYLSFLMLGIVLVGMNLEGAYRLAEGSSRNRLQPVVLGMFGVLGFLAYVFTTGLVYGTIETDNLVAMVVPLTLAYLVAGYGFLRGSLTDASAPISRGVVYSSFTTLVAVVYLIAMGVASQLATLTGWTPGHVVTVSFAFMVILVALGFFFSARFKRRVRRFIDRHFYVDRYDYRTHWSRISADLDPSRGVEGLVQASERLLADVLQADAVSIALRDRNGSNFVVRGGKGMGDPGVQLPEGSRLCGELLRSHRGLLLDGLRNSHPETELFQRENPGWFAHTAAQILAPLFSGDDFLGIVGLTRDTGDPFTFEDVELLDNTAAQIAAALRGASWGRDLAEAQEMELISNWSNMLLHDLKNYLSPLRMIVQNMQDHLGNPEFQREAVEDISEVTGQMDDLILRLGDLRKGQSLANMVVSIDPMVADVLRKLKTEGRPGISLVTRLESESGVTGDVGMLRRVVQNLVTNALEAMKDGGTLTLVSGTRPVPGNGGFEVVLTVSDTGGGMDAGFVNEKLFRPFATSKKRGLGLGLYQSRSIVRAHGGDILVQSAPGSGAEFQVVLPGMPIESGVNGRTEAELVSRSI